MCTYWNKVNLAKLKTKRKKKIDSIGIGLASPEEIRRWGERRLPNGTLIGKVDKDHTVDYESLKPIQGGLFCERIFGPVEDFYCSCERRGEKNEKYCPTCEVEFTKSRVRRTRMGYIPLAVPVAHVWYLRGRPSYIANLIGKSRNAVDRLAYGETLCESFIGKTSLDFFRLGEIDTQSKQHHLLAPTKNQTKQFSFLPAHRKSETEEKKEEIDLTITNKSQIFSNKITATQPIQPYLDNLLNKGEPVPFHSRQFARSYGMKEIERISACIVTAKEMNRIISIIDYPEGLRVATSSLQCSIVQRAYCTRFVSTVSKAKMITNTTNLHSNLETPFLTQYHLLYYVRYRLDRLYKRYNKQSIPALCIPIEARKVTSLQSVPSSVLCAVQIVNAQAKKKRVLSHTKVSISSFCLTNNDSSMHHRCKGKKQWSDVEGRDHSFRYSFVSHSSPLLRMEYGGKKEYNLYPGRSKGLSQSSRENKLTKVVSQVIKKEADSKFVTRYTEIQKKVNIVQFPRLARLISTTQHNELILTKYNKLHSLPLFSTFVYKEWSHRFSFFEYFIWLARKEDLALPFYSSKMEQQHESNICYTARQNFLNLVKDKFLLRFFPSIKKGMLTTQTQYKRFQTSTTKGLHSMTNFVGTAALPTSLVQQDHRRRDSNQFFQLRTKKGFLMLDLQSKTLSDDNSQIREHRKKHVIVTSARRGLFSAHLAYSLNETNWGMSKELVNSRSFFCTNKTKSVNVISKWDNTSICVTPTVSSFANMANNGLSNYVLTTNLNDKKKEDPIENLSILTHTQQNNKWVGKLGVDDTQQFPRLTELLSFTGGTALRYLLSRFDLVFLGKFLRHELKNLELKVNNLLALKMLTYSQGLLLGKLAKRRSKQLRRLKLMELFQSQKSNPEWMVLSVLPVLPPDLRPILRVNDDFVVASDLNRLYQTVLRRNNTIHERLDDPLPCPESGLFRQRSLQKAVDGLLENGKGGGTPLCASKRRPLVSLSHVLKGKKGLFRQHLLGKRVDYSGRSVIVVGPKLSLHECGLPKEMAMELFQPFLLYKLKAKGLASSNTTARRLIQQEDPIVWQILKQLVYEHPVLLNRAPTLHRLGIQAFQPRLVSGRAILLHPLVCNGFNADFDGDQMAVHVPLSFQARAEAWKIMWSKNNLLSPATGQPILVPSQDMVLGCYYLSVFVPRVLGFLTPSVSTVAAASSQQDSLLTFFEGNEYSEDNMPSQGHCYTNQLPMLRKTVRSTETGLAKHGKLVGTDENAMMRMPNNVFHSSLFSSSVENPFVEKHRTTWSQSIGQLQRKLEDRMFLSTGKKKSPGTKGFDIFKMKYRGSLSPVLCNKLKKHDQVNRSTLPTSLVQLAQLFGITYRSTHQILLSLEWGKKKQQATLLTIWHKVLNPFLYGNTYTFYANKMSPAFLRIRVKPIPSLTFSKREMERKFVTTRMYKDRSQRWLALFPFSNTTKTIQGHSTRKYVSYITVSISKNKQVIMLPTMPVGLSFYSIFGEQKHTTKNIPLNNKTDVNFHYSSTNFINTIKLHSNHYLRRRDRLDRGYSKHFVQSVPSSKVMIGRRGRLKWKSNTCIEKGKKKGLYFSNLQDSLIAFFQGKLQTHTPFWVRLDSTDSFRSNLTGSLLASITSVGSAGGKQDNYSYPNPFGNAQTLPPSQHQVVQHIGTTFSGNRSTGNVMQKLIGEKADSKKRLTVSNLQIALLQPQYGSSHQVCKTLFQSYYHNIVVEGNDILDPPLELRLSADGTLVKVLPTFQHHFSYSATMVDQCQEKAIRYMRTTAGRVVINQALY